MRRRLTSAAVLLCLSMCLSQAAYAQLKDNIEINLFGGWSVYNSKKFFISTPQSVSPIEGKERFDNNWRAGARVGVYTWGHWGQEFFYSYEPNTVQLSRTTAPSSTLDLKTRIHNYGVTALYYFNDDESQGFRPFVSIGIGGTIYHLNSSTKAFARSPLGGNLPEIGNSHEIGMNYGVGFKTRGSGPVGFRGDLRGILGRPPGFSLPRQSDNPAQTVLPLAGALHNGEASVGVIFYFFDKR